MAEGRRMTAADVAAQGLAGEHGDFVRDAVALVARELMEAEICAEVGAELGEVSETRVAYRNGYRPREWEARVGEIELLIPRKRQGPAYFPSFLEPRRLLSRRSSRLCWRRMSTASRPGRSTGWWSSSGSRA